MRERELHAAVLSDTFNGTTIDPTNWTTGVLSGTIRSVYAKLRNLITKGSTGSDIEALATNQMFSGVFKQRSSSPTLAALRPTRLGISVTAPFLFLLWDQFTAQIDIGFKGGLSSAGSLNNSGSSVDWPTPVAEIATGTGGRSPIYTMAPWLVPTITGTPLGTFNPGWSSPQPFVIVGGDNPNERHLHLR